MHDDGPTLEDINRFGGDTGYCPRCGEEIWDQADFCPACGDAITHTRSRTPQQHARRTMIFITVTIIVLVAFILVVM